MEPAALTPSGVWVAARLCQHVHRLIYLATNCCHRTNNFLRDLQSATHLLIIVIARGLGGGGSGGFKTRPDLTLLHNFAATLRLCSTFQPPHCRHPKSHFPDGNVLGCCLITCNHLKNMAHKTLVLNRPHYQICYHTWTTRTG